MPMRGSATPDLRAVSQRLAERLATETDARTVLAVTAETIARALGVACASYGEVDWEAGAIHFPVIWSDGSVTVPSHYAYGRDNWFARQYASGRCLVVPDAADLLVGRHERHAMASSGSAAFVGAPLVSNGVPIALFQVISATPRAWTEEEVLLVTETAARTWRALDHIRLAARLREKEAALLERERHQAFLIDWADRVRLETSAQAVLDLTLERLGLYLDVDCLNYVEVWPDRRRFGIGAQYVNGIAPTIGRHFPVEVLGAEVLDRLYANQLVCVPDTQDHPLIPPERRAHYVLTGSIAFAAVPLVRHDETSAALVAQIARTRVWTDGEQQLMRDIADRLWAIVERARFEEQLRESEALLTAFMANAPVGMHLKDANGAVIRANPELSRLLRVDPAALIGSRPAALLPAEAADQFDRIDRDARAGRAASIEVALASEQEGDPTWLLALAFPIGNGDDARTGGFTIDVSERRRAAEALERSREALFQTEKLSALGSLLAGVSHELNNPLSIVVAQAVMMERQARGGELADRAGRIRKAADRCARIVQTFLAMARQKRPERESVDLNAVAVAAHELVNYGLRSDHVTVVRGLAPDLPRIAADEDQLHQVLVNLLVNAQQALTAAGVPEPRITIRTGFDPATNCVRLDVADNGPGVPERLRRRIFEPFYTTKPQGEGTGVGLSFSQGLAEAHGGRLEYLAEPAGGACFRLTLPVEAPVIADPTPVAAVADTGPERRALVVDDEGEIAEVLADFLTLEGYRCDVAVGGAAAKAVLERGPDFDLVVSDLRMPDIDGPALHGWIEANRPDLLDRVAFATGDTLGSAAARFLARVRRPVLEKPFTPEAVQRFLERVASARN